MSIVASRGLLDGAIQWQSEHGQSPTDAAARLVEARLAQAARDEKRLDGGVLIVPLLLVLALAGWLLPLMALASALAPLAAAALLLVDRLDPPGPAADYHGK